MTEVARKQKVTDILKDQKRRYTYNPSIKIDDIRAIDMDDWSMASGDFNERREVTVNKFFVKSFLKTCYSLLSHGDLSKDPNSILRRMTAQPNLKQLDSLRLTLKEESKQIKEEAIEDRADSDSNSIPHISVSKPGEVKASHQRFESKCIVKGSIKPALESEILFSKHNLDAIEKHEKRKEQYGGKMKTHQRTISKELNYDKMIPLKESSTKKKRLNQVIQ